MRTNDHDKYCYHILEINFILILGQNMYYENKVQSCFKNNLIVFCFLLLQDDLFYFCAAAAAGGVCIVYTVVFFLCIHQQKYHVKRFTKNTMLRLTSGDLAKRGSLSRTSLLKGSLPGTKHLQTHFCGQHIISLLPWTTLLGVTSGDHTNRSSLLGPFIQGFISRNLSLSASLPPTLGFTRTPFAHWGLPFG